MTLLEPLFNHTKTTLASFFIALIVSLGWFLGTLGVDISYPQPVYYGILPLVWHFGHSDSLTIVSMLQSGSMIFLCLLGRIIIAAVAAFIIGYVFFWIGRGFAVLDGIVKICSPPSGGIPRLPRGPGH
jgi:hypothetical protein